MLPCWKLQQATQKNTVAPTHTCFKPHVASKMSKRKIQSTLFGFVASKKPYVEKPLSLFDQFMNKLWDEEGGGDRNERERIVVENVASWCTMCEEYQMHMAQFFLTNSDGKFLDTQVSPKPTSVGKLVGPK